MTENSFGTQDILTGRGLGIGGFGYGAGHGSFASPSSVQHSLNHTGQMVENQADATREFLGSEVRSVDKSLENLERGNSFNRICDAINSQNNVMGQNMLQLTRDMADARAEAARCCCDTQKAVADAAKDAAKCCCDAQLLANSNHATAMAAISSIDSRNVERAYNSATAELTSLKTQVACGCCVSK